MANGGYYGLGNVMPNVPNFSPGPIIDVGKQILIEGATQVIKGALSSSATDNFQIPQGAENIEIVSQNGKRSRRRRRKLLTCSDKSDIAFLHGQLGGGQLGRAAISSLLSRRCG